MTSVVERTDAFWSTPAGQLLARQPERLQQAYWHWWFEERTRGKTSHRDTVEAFVAGWTSRDGRRNPIRRSH